MRKLRGFCTPGLFLLFALFAPLHAQTAPANTNAAPASPATSSPAPVQTPTQTPDQAPDEATKKISELVHAGKYAEAQQLTAGLLIAYPTDQRLIRAKALIERLIAQAASPAGAPPAQPAAAGQLTGANLTGMDKVDYNALLDLARQAQQTTDLTEQTRLLVQFMDQSSTFLQLHPEQMLLWQLRAATAISLNQPMEGYEAGQKLLAGGAAESNDSGLLSLLGQLKNKGWLNKQQAETLQIRADEDRRQQAAVAEAEAKSEETKKYTFPVAHADGFHYAYGHITINEDGAVYVGSDGTIRMPVSDMRELKSACFSYDCGLYFTPKSGRKYFIVAVHESSVTNRTDNQNDVLPPSVLGNAAIARWHWVASADNKSIIPPPDAGSATPARGKAAAHPSKAGQSALEPAAPALMNTPAPAPSHSSAMPDSAPGSAPATAAVAFAPGVAVLHVYRQHQVAGMGVKTEIDLDGKAVAKLANEEVMRIEVPAGKHNISAVAGRIKTEQPLYDFEMEAGKEYWVHVEFTNGFITHLKLDTVPDEQAEKETKSLKNVGDGDSPKK